jgi:hypothetical protein
MFQRGWAMNRTAAGIFDTYAAAGQVVRELELLGISGGQVEVVSDASYDVRGAGIVPKPEHDNPGAANEDYTVVIVRPSDDRGMEQAKNLMDRYGAKLYRWQITADSAPLKDGAVATPPDSSIGGAGTTGHDPVDLEGRGKQIKVQAAKFQN